MTALIALMILWVIFMLSFLTKGLISNDTNYILAAVFMLAILSYAVAVTTFSG